MNLSGANETVASSVEHESQTFSGLTVYKGKACGTAICMSSSDLEIPQFQIEECDADYECRRLLQAIQTVEKHLTAMEQDLALLDGGANPVLRSLVIDGIFGGVGSVLSFLPTIVSLKPSTTTI